MFSILFEAGNNKIYIEQFQGVMNMIEKKLTDQLEKAIVDYYQYVTPSIRKISAVFHLSITTVHRVLTRNAVNFKPIVSHCNICNAPFVNVRPAPGRPTSVMCADCTEKHLFRTAKMRQDAIDEGAARLAAQHDTRKAALKHKAELARLRYHRKKYNLDKQ